MKVTITYSYDLNRDAFGGYWAKARGEACTGHSFEEAKERLLVLLRKKAYRETILIPQPEEVEI